MKILFINVVPPPRYIFVDIQIGVLSLSAVLERDGHKTALLTLWEFNKEKIENKIQEFKPELIACSTASDDFPICKDIIFYINDKFSLPVVLGGIHATVSPEECIDTVGLLGLCIGEGELAISEFVDKFSKGKDYTTTHNFWFIKNGKLIKNKMYHLIQNLDLIPFPNRKIVDYQALLDQDHRADFLAGRGCPYQCTYCANPHLQRIHKGKYVRKRSVSNVIKEIKQVLSDYSGIHSLNFFDDTFIINKEWLKEFSERYPKEINLPFSCSGNPRDINEEVVKYLKKAGCEMLCMGVEHGNDYLRNEVLGRRETKEQIITAFDLVKKAGIKAWAFNIVGVPYETEQTLKETIEFNKKLSFNNLQISIFHPYPATRLYNLCRTNGWIGENKARSYLESSSCLNLPSVSKSKLEYYHRIFRPSVMYPKFAFIFKLLAKLKLYDFVYIVMYKSFFCLRQTLPSPIKRPLFKILKV